MIVEGQRVAYAGDDPLNDVGSQGKVVALSGTAAHVQWLTGPKVGSIDLVEQFEVVAAAQPRQAAAPETFDYALDMMTTSSLQVRATYDESGEDGVVSALDEVGHLAMLGEHVERALGGLAGDLRGDPIFREVLAQLEPDEADTVLNRVASVLLTDRMKET